jgi:hypothetical protein
MPLMPLAAALPRPGALRKFYEHTKKMYKAKNINHAECLS